MLTAHLSSAGMMHMQVWFTQCDVSYVNKRHHGRHALNSKVICRRAFKGVLHAVLQHEGISDSAAQHMLCNAEIAQKQIGKTQMTIHIPLLPVTLPVLSLILWR